MDYTDKEKRFLSALGRTDDGRDLLALFTRAKAHYSSIAGISPGGDYGAQVEGRKIFIKFIEDIESRMKTQSRPSRPVESTNYE